MTTALRSEEEPTSIQIKTLFRLFSTRKFKQAVNEHLPFLFQIAEIECSRNGKVGMEVGTFREQILIALLVHLIGKENVDAEISITKHGTDVKAFGKPLSIKTKTGSGYTGIKLKWTVDSQQARRFIEEYEPFEDLLLAIIRWEKEGFLFFIPTYIQTKAFRRLGESFFKLPKQGSNPRGVEYSSEAMTLMLSDSITRRVSIQWSRREINYEPYQRWLKLIDNEMRV